MLLQTIVFWQKRHCCRPPLGEEPRARRRGGRQLTVDIRQTVCPFWQAWPLPLPWPFEPAHPPKAPYQCAYAPVRALYC